MRRELENKSSATSSTVSRVNLGMTISNASSTEGNPPNFIPRKVDLSSRTVRTRTIDPISSSFDSLKVRQNLLRLESWRETWR